MGAPVQAFFLTDAASAQHSARFCLYHPAQGSPRGAVLYLHPLAEEMNKSRRMAAQQARALAQDGFHVLQIDLLGCGDSAGEFADARWSAWLEDVLRGCRWLRERCNAPLWLWGLRAGCLLAADAVRQLDEPVHLLFWQPTLSGKLLMQQWLRLKAAADLTGGQAKTILQGLREQLARGEAVEIAGYTMAAELAGALEQTALTPPNKVAADTQLVWLEVSTRADATFSPVSQQAQAAWHQAGYALHSQIVSGPAFWQTTEIEEAPALIAATLAALQTLPS